MRAFIIIFFCFLLPNVAKSQNVKAIPNVSKHKELTLSLIHDCVSDSAKSFTIFRWITKNIDYDVVMYKNNADYLSSLPKPPQNLTQSAFDSWYDDQVALYVLNKRKGICSGYAALFKVMCNDAGMECNIISGYARTFDETIGMSFPINHAWNTVKYNGSWHLVDATWASGNVKGAKFMKWYYPYYYNTPPNLFINDHYPEQIKDALLPGIKPLKTFFETPLIWHYFDQHSVATFIPKSGRILASKDTTIFFRITFGEDIKDIVVEEYPGDSIIGESQGAISDEQKIDLDQKLTTKPSKINFNISTKEKEDDDAILSYVNSVKPNNNYYPSNNTLKAEPPQEPNLKVEGRTIIFKYLYRYTPKQVSMVSFFVHGDPILTYAIAPIQR